MVSNVDNDAENPERREATDCFMQARTAIKNGEVASAEKLLKRALQLWPDNYNYTLQLAKLAIQVGKNEREIEDLLQKTSVLNLTATEPRLLLATQYEKVGQNKKALSVYKGVLNIDPTNLIVRRKLGQQQLDAGQTMTVSMLSMKLDNSPVYEEPALTPKSKAVAPQTTSKASLEDRLPANAYATQPLTPKPPFTPEEELDFREVKTLKDVKKLPLNEIKPEPKLNLDAFQQQMQERPTSDDIPTYSQESSQSKQQSSNEDWQSLIEAIQHDSQMYEVDGHLPMNVAISYIEVGLYSEAVEELQEAWKLFTKKSDPEASRSCQLLIDCLFSLERYQEAIEWCNRGIELNGRNSSAGKTFLHRLATSYERLGDTAMANQLRAELGSDGTLMPSLPMPYAQPIAALRFALRFRRGYDAPEYILNPDLVEIVIGRGPKAHIMIDSPRVSKEHALLRFTQSGLKIINLSRTNGTFVNGEKLEPDVEYPIDPGDVVGLGKTIDVELISK
jgi:tetratricopeptide (TPR) repeat protein